MSFDPLTKAFAMIRDHGPGAQQIASEAIADSLRNGDNDAMALWIKVHAHIVDIQSGARKQGDTAH